MEVLFELKDLWKIYKMKGVETLALKGINLKIYKSEYISIIGPSGSGKSTLLHILGCLDTPTKGKVFINGKEVSKLSELQLALIRRDKIGFVFQAYNLISGLNAVENVSLPLRLRGTSKIKAEKKAIELLEMLGLNKRLNHKPSELSGGEQQRVAIARALINNPEAILADEPTGNLDTKTSIEIVNILSNLNKEFKKTIVVVTHDVEIAKKTKKRIHIRDGKIIRSDE